MFSNWKRVFELNSILKLLDEKTKKKFFQYIFIILFGLLLELFSLALLYKFIDYILAEEQNSFFFLKLEDKNALIKIIIPLVTVFLVFLIKSIYMVFSIYKLNYFIYSINCFFSIEVYNRYLCLSYEKLKSIKTGEIFRNILTEIPSLTTLISSYIYFYVEVLTISIIISVLIFYDPIISILGISSMGCFILIYNSLLKNRIKLLGQQRQSLELETTTNISETFSNLREIRLYNLNESFKSELLTNFKSKTNVISKHNTINQSPRYFFEIASLFSLIILISTMFYLNYNQKEIIFLLGIITVTIFRVLPSVNKIITNYQSINYYKPTLKLIVNLFEKLKPIKLKKVGFNKEIRLENINKSYNDTIILDNISLTINKGEFVGLVGVSGSGKSTLLDIISGLLTQNSGDRIIDGIKTDYMVECSYISQDSLIFSSTLKSNIILNKTYDKELFYKALKHSGLSEFYNEKKGDYIIEEKGSNLSGGQKQRIAIARAIYQDNNLIILDEPSSSQDKLNKNKILEFLNQYKTNKSIILVTHDQEMLRYCDKIYKIENNNIEII